MPNSLSEITPDALNNIWGKYLLWKIDSISSDFDKDYINKILVILSDKTGEHEENYGFPRVPLKIDMYGFFKESRFEKDLVSSVVDFIVLHRPDADSLEDILNSVKSTGFKPSLEK